MSTAEPGLALLETLRLLQASARELKDDVERPAAPAREALCALPKVIEALGRARQPRPVRCPLEYANQWERVLSGDRDTLEPRAVRYLCWNPNIATDPSFQYYLDRFHSVLNARSIQGLVSSCHARWSPELARSQVVTRVLDRLHRYHGPNRLLQTWKAHAEMILGPYAQELLGQELVKSGSGVGDYCKAWGISGESTPFVQMAVEHAATLCLDDIGRVKELQEFLFRDILPWSGWSPERFKHAISRLILESAGRAPLLIETITHAVLRERRLGDPRLRQNQNNWLGIDAAARRIKEWLSTADITFFFEHVLPDRKDPHGRKTFWLRYVGSPGLVSRPLLNDFDKYRLRDILWKKRHEVSHFGEIEGNTSAFLLDFGPILVVEFSVVGNACYIYEKRVGAEIVPDFWIPKGFRVSDLKSLSKAASRVVHKKARFAAWQRDGWEDEIEGILARYGIRAVS